MTVEEILQECPHQRAADVHDTLAYAYEHPDEIEADLATDDEDAAQGKSPPSKAGGWGRSASRPMKTSTGPSPRG
jgi:hypothetical protein